MSGGLEALQLKEEDVQKFLAAQAHIGDPNVTLQMAQYVYKVRTDGRWNWEGWVTDRALVVVSAVHKFHINVGCGLVKGLAKEPLMGRRVLCESLHKSQFSSEMSFKV